MAELPVGFLTADDEKILTEYATGKENVVELGCYKGRSAAIMSRVAKHVTSIDIFENTSLIDSEEQREHYERDFDETRYMAYVQKTLDGFPNVTLVSGLTYLTAKDHENVDLLFIDADHSYKGVSRDFYAWFPSIKVGGNIIFHDYSGTYPEVVQFVNELKKDTKLQFIRNAGNCAVFEKVSE